jgi:hypothetical protein
VVDRLNTDDPRHKCMGVPVNVLEKFELRARRSDHENLVRSFQSASDLVIEVLAIGGVPSFRGDRRVAMHVAMGGMKGRFLKALAINLKDLRFRVIDPNGGMIRHVENLSAKSMPYLGQTFSLFTAPIRASDRFEGAPEVAGN